MIGTEMIKSARIRAARICAARIRTARVRAVGKVGLCASLAMIFILLPALALAGKEDGKLDIAAFADNVWLYHSHMKTDDWGLVSSNGLVVVDQGDAYIIDTPWSEQDTLDLLAWIETQGFTPKASITTHFHLDRSAGISVLNERNIDTWASRQTNQLLAQQGWAKASHEFEGDEFSLLDGVIEAYYPGPGHAMDNIVVWLPQAKILDGGCMIREISTTSLGHTNDGSVPDWANSVEKVIQRYPQVEAVIPGHGQPGGAELLDHTQELTKQ